MRKTRAILARVLLALAIGAVVTVGVAVGCAMRSIAYGPSPPKSGHWLWRGPWTERGPWREYRLTQEDRIWGSRRVGVLVSPLSGWLPPPVMPGPETGEAFPLEALPLADRISRRTVRIAGWPCECVWGAVDEGLSSGAAWIGLAGRPSLLPVPIGAVAVRRTLDPSDLRGICGYLPVTPIWSGLALNTLFYAAIAWGLLFGPGAVRRWRRCRGGRCVKCGYDVKGLAPGSACPECGGAAAR